MDKAGLGKIGEEAAAGYLEKNGYRIIARNFKKEFSAVFKGEIDIIAKKDGFIIFVEVKSAKGGSSENFNFFPEDRVDWKKKKIIKMVSQAWLDQNKIPLDSLVRFDVISVFINPNTKETKISHFENAF